MTSRNSSLAGRWLVLSLGVASMCLPRSGAADPPAAAAPANGGWQEIDHKGSLVIYSRDRPGTSIKETRAVGTLNAPNWVIKNVLDDAEHYPEFMPYIVESKVLWRNVPKHTLAVYTRMTPPLIDPRDYTLLIHDEAHKADDGTIIYGSRWNAANERGPAERSGTVRVGVNDGSWVLESIDNGEHTRGTYTLFTDGGGGIPAFVFNTLSKRRLNELYEVLSKQAQDAKYRQTHPAGP